MIFRQGKYWQAVTYTAYTSTLPFKDNRLRSQVPNWTSTLACTSDQFRSSWRPGPNHTLWMQMVPSYQWKGPGWGTSLLQAPNHRLSLLSKKILAPAICSYLATAFFPAFMSRRRDSYIIGVRRHLRCKRASKRDTTQGWICPLIPKPIEQRLQSEDLEKGTWGQPCRTNRSIAKALERFLFSCTTTCGL